MSMIMQWDAVAPDDAEHIRSLDTDAFVEWLEQGDERLSFEVDKAWHAVHFTLTGNAWSTDGPLGQAVLGGESFGEEIGYGPARWLRAESVSEIAGQLAGLTPETFEERLDLGALRRDDVYPSIWDRDAEAEELVAFVRGGYEQIRDGFAQASRAGHGFVITLI